jgi:histone deacetylase 1/2
MENLPLGRNAIGNKWVFKVKAKTDGSVDRFKARLFAQGFSQRARVDYSETISHVVKLGTLRTVLAIAAKRNCMHMPSADIETAFLNAGLQEEIYMRQPKGTEDGTPRIMRLLKSIYGLKQASREWYKLSHQTLSSLGLKRATSDNILYTMHHPLHGICIVLVYVDDILIILDSLKWIESAKRAIGEHFRMTDFGEAKFIVGMDIVRSRGMDH